MKNSKKLFDKRYKEIMEELSSAVKNLLVTEGLDINPIISNKSQKLDEMARAAVKRTIDKKAYANTADAIRRRNYDIEWAKTVSPSPKLDDFQLLHRYVSALLCLKQPCPQTEADIDKIGVFADYAKTLIDDDHTGTLDDIITLYNEQDPIESRGTRTGVTRAAKGFRKPTNAETSVSTDPVVSTPVQTTVSKETEEVPASDFSFDDDEEETTPTATISKPDTTDVENDDTVETPEYDDVDSDDEFDFEDEEDTTDEEDDSDDALDNDSEDATDDEAAENDDDNTFDFEDDEEDEPKRLTPSKRTKITDDEDDFFSSDADDDALDNDSEDDDDDDNPFGDDDDFFSNVDDDDDTTNDVQGRDDTVWGNEAHTDDDDDEEDDDNTSKITNMDDITYEQYMDPEMNEAFHNFSPNKILLNDDGKIGFEFTVSADIDDEETPCSIFRATFGEALRDYIIMNQASIDAMDDIMFQFSDSPVIRQFKKKLSKIISNDDTMDDELTEKAEEVCEKCFYKAKTVKDVIDYIEKM